jgi:hypothetical protein
MEDQIRLRKSIVSAYFDRCPEDREKAVALLEDEDEVERIRLREAMIRHWLSLSIPEQYSYDEKWTFQRGRNSFKNKPPRFVIVRLLNDEEALQYTYSESRELFDEIKDYEAKAIYELKSWKSPFHD